jgi:putative endonuclease
MPFYTYIIYSAQIDKNYVGSTENTDERSKKHIRTNSRYTNRVVYWKFEFLHEFDTKSGSLAFDKKIKI